MQTDEKPETVNGAPVPDKKAQRVAFEQIVVWMYERIAVHTKGLFVYSANLPPEVQLEAVAQAMGRVMSENTITSVPAVTLAVRAKCAKGFEEQLKAHISALTPVHTTPPGVIMPPQQN